MSRWIDLNCDMGEGYGVYSIGADDELFGYVTSANIACGFHAGDPATMRRTVRRALEAGVSVGAHPGLPDRLGFGRRAMGISPEEARDLVAYQIGALDAFLRAEGGRMTHVKPHGALYAMAAADESLAVSIAEAVCRFDPELILLGLSGSESIRAAERIGLCAASEAFADRTYQQDGSLTPRGRPGAVIEKIARAADQAVSLATLGTVRSLEGIEIAVRADTLCIHGDTPGAAALAREIRHRLEAAGVGIRALPGR